MAPRAAPERLAEFSALPFPFTRLLTFLVGFRRLDASSVEVLEVDSVPWKGAKEVGKLAYSECSIA